MSEWIDKMKAQQKQQGYKLCVYYFSDHFRIVISVFVSNQKDMSATVSLNIVCIDAKIVVKAQMPLSFEWMMH